MKKSKKLSQLNDREFAELIESGGKGGAGPCPRQIGHLAYAFRAPAAEAARVQPGAHRSIRKWLNLSQRVFAELLSVTRD